MRKESGGVLALKHLGLRQLADKITVGEGGGINMLISLSVSMPCSSVRVRVMGLEGGDVDARLQTTKE